jgi:4-alpha-glucanotransferase
MLMHITSLPSLFGIGDMGPWAYRFADFLAEAKQTLWQILPLTPTEPDHYSPYLSPSAFAGNPMLISPELLARDGFLSATDLQSVPDFPIERVDYPSAVSYKTELLARSYDCFVRKGKDYGYEAFCEANKGWLDDFSFFAALKERYGPKKWTEWPAEMRDRQPEAIRSVPQELGKRIEMEKFFQYVFFRQWLALKRYCNERSIQIIGDIPIYVHHDSADLWANPTLFKLDENKRPYVVSGVPPDYFSETGQLWGHPIYRWDVLRETGYEWWINRIEHNLRLCDLVRIDHFRGLVGYWEVPAGEKTAVNGRWVHGPGASLFQALVKRFPFLPIIAEDLGIITPDVREVMRDFDLPGMKVLLFAFGERLSTNPYAPHNFERNCVAYTGTHDNNTTRGWFEKEATDEERKRLIDYIGHEVDAGRIHWELIRLLMMSVANMAIFPMQDILGLGQDTRMNTPAVPYGNWQWRLSPDMLKQDIATKLRAMTELYRRA